MVQERVLVSNVKGLHLSAAAEVVKVAAGFECGIWLVKDGVQANARSIMGIITLVAPMGSEVIVKADGADEEDAVRAIVALFNAKFYEEA
jgi:phosphocarrier protein HPr